MSGYELYRRPQNRAEIHDRMYNQTCTACKTTNAPGCLYCLNPECLKALNEKGLQDEFGNLKEAPGVRIAYMQLKYNNISLAQILGSGNDITAARAARYEVS